MKTKRLMSIVLALAMIFTMFGNLTAFAIDVPTEYKFMVNATDKSGSPITGGTFTISYGDAVSAELPFGEENTVSILNQNTATFDLKTPPTGYYFTGRSSVNFTLGDSDLSAFTDAGMTASLSGNTYTIGLEYEQAPLLPPGVGSTTYDISIDPMYNTSGGTITTDKVTAKAGEKIKVSVKLNDGYDCSYVSCSNADDASYIGETLEYTTNDDGTRIYEITMPANNLRVFAYLYAIKYTYHIYFDNDSVNANDLKYQLTVDGIPGEETSFEKNSDNTNEAVITLPYSDKDKTVEFKITGVPYGYEIPEVLTFTCGAEIDFDSAPDNYTSISAQNRYWNISFHLDLAPITELAVMAQGQDEVLPEDSVKYTLTVGETTTEEITMKPTEFFNVESLNVNGKDATIIVTQVPDGYLVPEPISFAFDGNNEAFKNTQYELKAVSVNPETGKATYAILVTLEKKPFESPFTVSAKVNSSTTDKNADTAGVQVNAKDTVKVDVAVDGGAFTNADWELVYNPTMFKYVGTTTNVDTSKCTVTLDSSKTAVLSGKLLANAGVSADDEFADGTAIVTYEFEALAQKKDVTGLFKIESAHANNYEMAGTMDNYAAKTENATVDIVLVKDSTTDEGTTTTPAGTFDAKTVTYNAQYQLGNAFVLAEQFEDATVTYFANEDGSAVDDETTLGEKKFTTTLPKWKNVGTYTYYAKITGAGLATTYVSTTLTITPATLTPSANFDVDPDVTEVKFTPTLEGVLDGSHNGTVTVKYTDKTGVEQTKTLNASDFVYDGETTSVYKGTEVFAVNVPTSGEFTVTLDYTEGTGDNYTGTENEVKVDVDKINAEQEIAQAIEDAITNEFVYDSEAHSVVIDDDEISAITDGTWVQKSIENVNDAEDTEMTVTNVGEDKLIKIVYEDETGYYNDVVVYTVLKVTPANVKITADDNQKVMNDTDPVLTGTVKVVDGDGNEVVGTFNDNGLYGEDNLDVTYEREIGEEVGTYEINASYVPNDNYTVEIEKGTFTITEPTINPDDPDAKVKVEVVDHSAEVDGTPDYTAGKRLILVYTNIDKLFYGYGDSKETAEKMFDVTDAGYKYTKYTYAEDGTVTADNSDTTEYKHVYGIVVDAIDSENTGAALETEYRNKVVFLGNDLSLAPANIVYDGDINLTNEIDVNDYSMTNGIYNNKYARETYIKNILKADINGDKKVDTDDVMNIKTLFETKNK